MRLRHIEVFHAVMLAGSVSGAARVLNISQPVVTRVVQHAEAQLGFALFRRLRGRLLPTDEARVLFPQVARLYGELSELRQAAAQLRRGSPAPLRVALVPALIYQALPRALARFLDRYPKVPLLIDPQHSGQAVAALARDAADVGFVFDTLLQPTLDEPPLARGRIQVVAPRGPQGFGRSGRTVSLGELARRRLIHLEPSDPLGALLHAAYGEAGLVLERGISVKTYLAALSLVEQGLGVAVIDPITAAAADRSKTSLHPLQPRIEVTVKCVRAAHGRAPAQIDYLIESMQQALSELMP
jgi:DNA-binding transcriptional LysR family regulator